VRQKRCGTFSVPHTTAAGTVAVPRPTQRHSLDYVTAGLAELLDAPAIVERAGGEIRELDAGLFVDEGMSPHDAADAMPEHAARGDFAVRSHPDWVERLADERSATTLTGLLRI
jgi:hypothetical protein